MAKRRTQHRRKGLRLYLLLGAAILVLAAGGVGLTGCSLLLTGNVRVAEGQPYISLKIPKGATYSQVLDSLRAQNALKSETSFQTVAELLDYPRLVKYGYYRLEKGTGNLALVRQLRGGAQSPMDLRIRFVRTPHALASQLGQNMAASTDAWQALLTNDTLLATYKTPTGEGFSRATVLALFLPNTYEVYWTDSPKRLLDRMHQAYVAFWNQARLAKAAQKNLSPLQVSILASIVMEENLAHPDEWPRLAGVYLNRLDRGMRLQADPTVKFAVGDFGLRRVLNRHLAVDSPYNTYKYNGLPPGPINGPTPQAIDAVLNAEAHRYLYFVASPGYGGYHQFSETLTEHNQKAAAYHRWLNQEGIR